MIGNHASYLIHRTLYGFLGAFIASTAIMSINGMADSVLMGHLIGPEAVSAIQNAVPVMGVIASISLLISTGASVIATKALGRRDFDEAGANSKFSIFNVNNNHSVTMGDIIFALNRHGLQIAIVTEKEFAGIMQAASKNDSYSESIMSMTAYEARGAKT